MCSVTFAETEKLVKVEHPSDILHAFLESPLPGSSEQSPYITNY